MGTVRLLRWKLRYYTRKLLGVRDGVYRGDPQALPSFVPGIQLYYTGAPGDPHSDEPVAYRRIYD